MDLFRAVPLIQKQVTNLIWKKNKCWNRVIPKESLLLQKKEGDCPYVISVLTDDNTKSLLDPINLEEAYMKDGEKVWFKYGVLRMMNRCDKASPINILEIKKGF